MGSPNWGALKAQGRAKDIGVSWDKDDLKALYEHKIPAAYVRRGCLTPEDYDAMRVEDEGHLEKKGELPIEAMTHSELHRKAKELEVDVTPDASEEGLRSILSSLGKPKKKAEKKVEKKAEKKEVKE